MYRFRVIRLEENSKKLKKKGFSVQYHSVENIGDKVARTKMFLQHC